MTVDEIETAAGASPHLCIYTSATGAKVAAMKLPADWLASKLLREARSSGSKTKLGTWESTSADGPAGYFRIVDNAGTAHIEGTVTLTGGGGAMTFDSATFAAGDDVIVTGFTLPRVEPSPGVSPSADK